LDDTDAIRILESCRRAMKPDARLVVIEAFFAEPGEQISVNMIDTQVPLFDLHLMLAVNGRERSIAEYSVLFDKVGLRTIKTTPLDNGYVVIEAAATQAGDPNGASRLRAVWVVSRPLKRSGVWTFRAIQATG
jgi:O-methyltransferase domain